MRKRTIELAVMLALALTALADGVRIVRGSGEYRQGLAGGFQVLIASLLVFCAIVYWVRAERVAVQWDAVTKDQGLRWVFIGFAIFAAYIAAMPVLGYMLSSTLAFIVYLRVYSSYRWGTVIGGSILLGVGSAYLWDWLETGLPQGFVPWP